ncbi:hypothetical protein [Saccharopolyspora kobensis]|uniref:hypothetical protein n=1 Tax=Saccharopolyspora kobensis TaxID=146035 RepID=UPI0011613656|nr:hypothetical protein [Saccharopolyspora kobensis]
MTAGDAANGTLGIAQDGGTHLVLVHSELVPEPAADFAVGWHVMVDAPGLGLDGARSETAWARSRRSSRSTRGAEEFRLLVSFWKSE